MINNIENIFNSINSLDSSSDFINETKSSILFAILDFLLKNTDEVQKLTFNNFENLPEIYADVVSAANNPSCSCRSRVYQYIKNNFDISKSVIYTILQNDQINNEILNKIYESTVNQFNSISDKNKKLQNNIAKNIYIGGQIFEIENSDEAYSNLIESFKSQNLIFKGLQIIEQKSKLKIYIY
jgi:hypothetical protein